MRKKEGNINEWGGKRREVVVTEKVWKEKREPRILLRRIGVSCFALYVIFCVH